MLIKRAYKTEMDPTPGQAELLSRHVALARVAWNWALEQQRLARGDVPHPETGKLVPYYRFADADENGEVKEREPGKIPGARVELKKEFVRQRLELFPWSEGVNAYTYHSALDDLDKAWANFFREMKKRKAGNGGDRLQGEPRFKGRYDDKQSCRLYGTIRVGDDFIRLPTVGMVKLKEAGYLPVAGVKVLNVTLSQRAQRWFVSLQVEEEVQEPAPRPVASTEVDVTTRTAKLSTGEQYPLSMAMRRLERRIAHLNRERDRRVKGSKNRQKTIEKLQRAHYRIACKRSDTLHQATAKITDDYTHIVARDMRSSEQVQAVQPRHDAAMAIEDAAWYEFRRELEYKAAWKGGTVDVVKMDVPKKEKGEKRRKGV